MFDHFKCGWHAHCTSCGPIVFWLPSIRYVEPFEGSEHSWYVGFSCPQCDQDDWTLRTSNELDLAPLTDPWPTHYEVQAQRTWWFGNAQSVAAHNLARGLWPLAWQCGDGARFGGPTTVKRLQPFTTTAFDVTFRCDCGHAHHRVVSKDALERPPALRHGW